MTARIGVGYANVSVLSPDQSAIEDRGWSDVLVREESPHNAQDVVGEEAAAVRISRGIPMPMVTNDFWGPDHSVYMHDPASKM